jgi:hypothetical protein
VHDLEPQDQPVEREFAEVRQRLDRKPGRFASHEEEADLSTLDEDALAIEAKREALRDQRQERWVRAEEAMQRRREGAVEIGLPIFVAMGSMAVAICGLANHNAEIVKAGLLALCAISGATVYQLRHKARPR